jgi:2-amino-4-hydroxy-6-hydroxymethyldihydropteridine diphosphokinase
MTAAPRVLATVALGSNLGDPIAELERALAKMARLPQSRLVARSRWRETEPVGGPAGQPRFQNGVVRLSTGLGPRELLAELQRIERESGRTREREVRHGPRVLDLDLVFYGDLRLASPELELPHPRAEERLFVLEPLAEFAPDEVLPGCGKSVRERVQELHAWSGH